MRQKPSALLCLTLASAAIAAPPAYRVDLVEPVPGVTALHGPAAINDHGWVIGEYGDYSAGGFGGYRVFLWKPGAAAADIGQPAGLPFLLAADINNDGKAVGIASIDLISSETNSHAWSWVDGEFTVYDQLVPGRPASVGYTNEAGRVIGWANDGSFTGNKALEYMPDGSAELLMPGATGSNTAVDVNNNDVLLGAELRGVYLWFPGAADRFILPPPSATLVRFYQQSLNDIADVVGSARVAPHPEGSTAVVWFDDGGWQILPRAGRFNTAVAINNDREVVGNSRDNTGERGDHGWYWTLEDGLHALEDLIAEPAATYGVLRAIDINERGQIAAVVMHRTTGDTFGAVLTPTDSGCYADCDASGTLDFFDFLCFQDLFAAGDPGADCDASGALDFFDFLCFQNAFAAGCR